MVANAAGPIMIMYLLAMRLPKLVFMGTSAWYFFVLNLFKVPFSYSLGLINFNSLQVSLVLAPFADHRRPFRARFDRTHRPEYVRVPGTCDDTGGRTLACPALTDSP